MSTLAAVGRQLYSIIRTLRRLVDESQRFGENQLIVRRVRIVDARVSSRIGQLCVGGGSHFNVNHRICPSRRMVGQ